MSAASQYFAMSSSLCKVIGAREERTVGRLASVYFSKRADRTVWGESHGKVISSHTKSGYARAGTALRHIMKRHCTVHSNFRKFIPLVALPTHCSCNEIRLRDTRVLRAHLFLFPLIYFISFLFHVVGNAMVSDLCVSCGKKKKNLYPHICLKNIKFAEIPFK